MDDIILQERINAKWNVLAGESLCINRGNQEELIPPIPKELFQGGMTDSLNNYFCFKCGNTTSAEPRNDVLPTDTCPKRSRCLPLIFIILGLGLLVLVIAFLFRENQPPMEEE